MLHNELIWKLLVVKRHVMATKVSLKCWTGARQFCTTKHFLNVTEEVKIKRQRALLGGGQGKIEEQHRKVVFIVKITY